MKKNIAVVGAGPGGLSAALVLSGQGHDVTVYEKDDVVGGRSKRIEKDGYAFDAGPTFLMYVELLEEVFRKGGYDLSDELELITLDPLYRLVFPYHTFDLSTDPMKNKEAFDSYNPGTGDAYLKWRDVQQKKLDAVVPILKRPFDSVFDYVRTDTLRMLRYLHPFQSLYTSLKKLDPNPGFIHSLSFQAKYLGMSSYDAPSAFSFLSYLEHSGGLYHVPGGLSAISRKMADLIRRNGGKVLTKTPVEKILVDKGNVIGVRVQGKDVSYDKVVVNADFGYMAHALFDPKDLKKHKPEKVDKKDFSVSTMNVYLGLDTVLPFPHHMIVFSEDYEAYLKSLSEGRFTEDISFYVHNPSVTDKTLAPEGHSALYLLVPVPNTTSEADWNTFKERLFDIIRDTIKERFGVNLDQHIKTRMTITPEDWKDDYNVHFGAVFNLSHKLSQMMHFRPHNAFEDVKGVHLVGGGTHPGSGLPTIYQSALISAEQIDKGR